MKASQELYNNIPPSLKRDEKPFIASNVSLFWRKISEWLLTIILKDNFATLKIKNSHRFKMRNKDLPNIIYAQHNCWWDGLIGYYLCRKVFKTDVRIMVEELHALPFLSKIGAFSIDKNSTSSILKSLNFAIDTLKGSDKSLFFFPQGIIRPPDSRPIEFESGLSYISQKLEGVNLIPLSFKYVFLREPSAEILIDVQKPITLGEFKNRKLLTSFLEDSFQDGLDKQRDEISQGYLRNYITILKKPQSILRRIEKRLKN